MYDANASNDQFFFSQELTNYGFTRYDNDEVICYKRGDYFSCVKKD